VHPTTNVLELSRKARATGLFAFFPESGTGLASAGLLVARGKDAARFLHAQLTNAVTALGVGSGNLQARVKRTGHLEELLSLHRLPDEGDRQVFLLVLERDRVQGFRDALDRFLFADDVELADVSAEYRPAILTGLRAGDVLAKVVPESAGIVWKDLGSHDVRALPGPFPEESLLVMRSLTGDRGCLLLLKGRDSALEARLREAARGLDLALPGEDELVPLLDTLRIEAGLVRVGVDTPHRERLLPETGLEQQAVSYTKGCFLGQEVIARVRTYGSLPFGLRALVLDEARGKPEALETLPGLGAPLVLESGDEVGQLVSRAYSPVLDAPVVLAYVSRAFRTPGEMLRLRLPGGGIIRARVALLPLYSAPGDKERVAQIYDRAVRVFAEGDEATALSLLEETLRLDPSFADGYEAVGVILGRSQRYHEAIDFFKRLEDVAPEEPIVDTNLSLYYMKLGDKQTAEDHAARAMQKSLALGRGGAGALAEIEEEQRQQQKEDAARKREMFTQVLEIDAEDPVALYGLGNALSVLEDWEGARDALERARAAQKDNSAVYLALGKALENLDRGDDAVEVYSDGMAVASKKGDLMPLREMEHRRLLLSGASRGPSKTPVEAKEYGR
jgi:folate-binding protein YgfZ